MVSNLRRLNLLERQTFCDGPILKAHGGYCDVFIRRCIRQGIVLCWVAIKRFRVQIMNDRDFVKVSCLTRDRVYVRLMRKIASC